MGEPAGDSNRRTIPATCRIAGHGPRGFCNLRLTKVNGEIVLDPHVTGACVIVLDETAAREVHSAIGEWLG
jgi:hypothetical protein